ncbi:hypothetical protein Aduo_002325 [Ancylostoma duodenale]
MGNGNMARQAVMMRRLTYECSLELSAYRSAKRCEDAVGNTTIAENRIMLPNTNVDFSFAAEQATSEWYSEIRNGQMWQATGSQNLFLPELKIPNFAKIIWDTHEKIGCVVHKCLKNKFTNVVCHYSPKGGTYGSTIYTMGPNCNRCKHISATCQKGLCVVP